MTTSGRKIGRARRGKASIAVVSSLVLFGGPVLLSAAPAMASPAAPAAPAAPTVAQVSARLDQLNQEAEKATEAYNSAGEQLASVGVLAQAAQVRVQQQQAVIAGTRRDLSHLAAQLYRAGQLSVVQVLLSDDPADLLTRAGLGATVADREVALVKRFADQQAELAQARSDVVAEQKQATAVQARVAANKATIESKIAQAGAQLNQLRADQRRALERASRDQQRKALLNAQKQSGSNNSGRSRGSTHGARGGPVRQGCAGLTINAPNAAAAAAVRFACAQLGKPYVYGAAGPGSYDCSGLTMRSWGAAGVSLPHSSSGQYSYGSHVSRSALEPGDLLFIYSPIHHVAIYIGNGLMIHAPHTGDVVRIAPVESTFVGATRL